jgi:hypothetical protein
VGVSPSPANPRYIAVQLQSHVAWYYETGPGYVWLPLISALIVPEISSTRSLEGVSIQKEVDAAKTDPYPVDTQLERARDSIDQSETNGGELVLGDVGLRLQHTAEVSLYELCERDLITCTHRHTVRSTSSGGKGNGHTYIVSHSPGVFANNLCWNKSVAIIVSACKLTKYLELSARTLRARNACASQFSTAFPNNVHPGSAVLQAAKPDLLTSGL